MGDDVGVDVIVVGGGPAGSAAALFCARSGLATALVDPLGVGGQLLNAELVVDYPGVAGEAAGWDLAAALGEQVLGAGVELVLGQAATLAPAGDGWAVVVDGDSRPTRAVLLATGCSPLPLPGPAEELEGRGVSYCAACDAGLFRGQSVAVVGGGDTGMAEALAASASAAEVVVLFREERPPAVPAWTTRVEARPNVRLVPRAEVVEVLGGEGGVAGLRYVDLAGGGPQEVEVRGVFGALGPRPNSAAFADVVATDERGFIRTTTGFACVDAPGVFAAGDVRAGASMQAAGAVGEGVAAAVAIRRHLGA